MNDRPNESTGSETIPVLVYERSLRVALAIGGTLPTYCSAPDRKGGPTIETSSLLCAWSEKAPLQHG